MIDNKTTKSSTMIRVSREVLDGIQRWRQWLIADIANDQVKAAAASGRARSLKINVRLTVSDTIEGIMGALKSAGIGPDVEK